MTKEIKNKLFVLSTITGKRVCVLFFKQGQLINNRIDLKYEIYNQLEHNEKKFLELVKNYDADEIIIAHNTMRKNLQPGTNELNSKQYYNKLFDNKGIKNRFFMMESNNLIGSGTSICKLNFKEY